MPQQPLNKNLARSAPGTKQHWQLRAIFDLAKRQGVEKDQLEAIAGDLSGGRTFRLSEMSYLEANWLVVRLGGDPQQRHPVSGRKQPGRTVRHHRQKAGVKQIAQHRHIELLHALAKNRWGSAFEPPLRSLAGRMRVPYPPHTTEQTNKLVEAVKAMNARGAANGNVKKEAA